MSTSITLMNFFGLFNNQDAVAKGILVVVLLLYTLFTLILANQIRSLSTVINQVYFSPIFKLFGYLHAMAAILLLLISVLLL